MYCSGQLIHCLKISGNKNNLRTIEPEIAKKLRTAQPQPKVTGSYKKKACIASDEPVIIAFDIIQDDKVRKSSDATERDSEEEVEEFDSSSDEEVEAGSADPNDAVFQAAEIGRSATFLLGARSSFGRAIWFNNRLLQIISN